MTNTSSRSARRLAKFRAFTRNVRPCTTFGLWFCTIAAVGLFAASFFMPPAGQIDPSVLKAAGYCFAFAGLYEFREAVLEGLGVKLTHGETTIEIKDQDGNSENIIEENETE